MSTRYPRTWHLPWSPGCTKEERRLDSVEALIGTPLVVTEKLDGSNLCLRRDALFARSHSGPPAHPSFDYAKALHSRVRYQIEAGSSLFGEYCFAVHSIRYDALPAYFLLFGVREEESGVWAAWEAVERVAASLGLGTVPVLWRGTVASERELQAVTERLMAGPSCYGAEREGVVVRVAGEFREFQTGIAKWVRADHVQTDEHWSDRAVERQRLAER